MAAARARGRGRKEEESSGVWNRPLDCSSQSLSAQKQVGKGLQTLSLTQGEGSNS